MINNRCPPKRDNPISGSSQDLRTRKVDAIRRGEEGAAPTGAECEEISVLAKVIETAERLGMEWNHAPQKGNDCATPAAESG